MLKATSGLVLAIFVGSAMAQDVLVPEPFRGTWDSRGESCGKGGEGSLTITATRIEFYAGRGKVLSVRANGPLDIEVEFDSLGEGGARRDIRRFVLSEDGQTITNVLKEGAKFSRVRCK